MLKVCQRGTKKWDYHVTLAQANAEELPFQDNTFDVVFHVGGINFFNDIPKAINEMIRVAKHGTTILICDETQEHSDTVYKRIPFVRRFYKDTKPMVIPFKHIPSHIQNITLIYSEDKSMYVITFTKP
jgi:ubiquinone/menaquinone biosynthesis C-methylase UbiE